MLHTYTQNLLWLGEMLGKAPMLCDAIKDALCQMGVEVLDIGLSGTEEMYCATSEFNACGGIQVTASHNRIEYNGLKMVKKNSVPLDPEKDLEIIKRNIIENNYKIPSGKGLIRNITKQSKEKYLNKIFSIVGRQNFGNLNVVVNSLCGAAPPVIELIEYELIKLGSEINLHKINHEPNGKFPNQSPDPLLIENQLETKSEILKKEADFGIIFDGDFDRCFFLDEMGNFIPGEYIVGLFAEWFLSENKKNTETIVYDNRVIWNIEEIINRLGGKSVKSKTGHAYMKQEMRKNDAIYGGELSSHHYFRDFEYCDSGVIPWLTLIKILSASGNTLSELIEMRRNLFPSSGEKNFKLLDPNNSMKKIVDHYKPLAKSICDLDGYSLSFDGWRFNLRSSNTEPLIRLNVESNVDRILLEKS